MQLINTEYKIRCEMGACKNPAKKTIKMNRVGIRSRIHICENCLNELYQLVGESLASKEVENLLAKKGKK